MEHLTDEQIARVIALNEEIKELRKQSEQIDRNSTLTKSPGLEDRRIAKMIESSEAEIMRLLHGTGNSMHKHKKPRRTTLHFRR